MRQVENMKLGRKTAHGAKDSDSWQMHIEGALGECALSKYLDHHWSGKGVLRGCDVGDVDVRTASKDNYRLILHNEDPDDRVFWLLTGANGNYQIKGWIMGWQGKHEKYWTDPNTGRPAFFVPQSALNAPEKWRGHESVQQNQLPKQVGRQETREAPAF